jgi:hypothetical protein
MFFTRDSARQLGLRTIDADFGGSRRDCDDIRGLYAHKGLLRQSLDVKECVGNTSIKDEIERCP